jgi:hypothetical protein
MPTTECKNGLLDFACNIISTPLERVTAGVAAFSLFLQTFVPTGAQVHDFTAQWLTTASFIWLVVQIAFKFLDRYWPRGTPDDD